MKSTTHKDHEIPSDARAGHKMTDDQGSHDRHAGHSVAMFRDKFWLSFALTIPVVIWSSDVQRWFGYTAPSFPGSKLIPAVLGTLVFVYGGLVFIRGARRELADAQAWHDDPHQPGDHCRVRNLACCDIWPLRDRRLVGARLADHDHGPRPLAGNAGHFPGSWRAQCTRGACSRTPLSA